MESDLEKVFAEHGKVNVVAVVESMEGYGFKEFLEDLRFVFKHWSQFQRVAVVGRSEWMKLAAKVDSALAPWEERFFTPNQIEQAWKWAKGKA
ncbi:STAS/SEC14 domain-containing protein [Desulfohalovibrio reitneri]|uniref:STAS/SEC14 domain-containing protein n=1 Tax=Desulfohalovibrio reitneri TaxID=1307759 RepID=UPI0004A6F075|nr:STAS/SEC14 domain-containing protein [Desulfohalovibrio reitneri]